MDFARQSDFKPGMEKAKKRARYLLIEMFWAQENFCWEEQMKLLETNL